ncbi:MAG: protein-L-isoaspartate O-methyltransferase [Reyranellaceae bacterium]
MKLNRRAVLGGLLAAPAAASLAAPSAGAAPSPWTFDTYSAAMKASGRRQVITAEQWQATVARKPRMMTTIDTVLSHHFGKADPNVMRAFAEVPREYYHYHYDEKADFAAVAYEETSTPWRIGMGSALSDYRGQAYMTQLCAPKPGERALEVGTGSGFQVSILSRIVERAHSIEIVQPLGSAVAPIFKPLGYDNIETRIGDGYYGWPEVEGGFDIVIVTCVAQHVPPPLLDQLKPGGRMVIPMGQPFKREQFLYVFTKDEDGKVSSRKDLGVYFIPMTGAALAAKP